MGNAQAFEQDLSTAEKEVWSMEETYWNYVANRDLKGYMTLWHEDFVGWPRGLKQPADKDRLIRGAKSWFGSIKPESLTFELTPHSVRIYGDVTIVHYLCSATWKDLKGNERSINDRMTHTWMKQDGKWKIIGGMSAD
jgi:ketosteroid isomerase-like protein